MTAFQAVGTGSIPVSRTKDMPDRALCTEGYRNEIGGREFSPVVEGSEQSERWKTEGFQGRKFPHHKSCY